MDLMHEMTLLSGRVVALEDRLDRATRAMSGHASEHEALRMILRVLAGASGLGWHELIDAVNDTLPEESPTRIAAIEFIHGMFDSEL